MKNKKKRVIMGYQARVWLIVVRLLTRLMIFLLPLFDFLLPAPSLSEHRLIFYIIIMNKDGKKTSKTYDFVPKRICDAESRVTNVLIVQFQTSNHYGIYWVFLRNASEYTREWKRWDRNLFHKETMNKRIDLVHDFVHELFALFVGNIQIQKRI